MRVEDRLKEIVSLIDRYGRMQVKELALRYRVTEDLIRKDLKKLEAQGLIDRVYGGAERIKNKFEVSSIHYRMQVDDASKHIIAGQAVALIKKGDYLFLDTSSTSAAIARHLTTAKKEVTVITAMLEIITMLAEVDCITLIAIGGVYNPYTGGFGGQEALRQIHTYRVDKTFISCRSVDLESGHLICGFIDIGHEKKAALDIAREKIVSTQLLKYQNSGVFVFYDLKAIDRVIVEDSFSEDQLKHLKKYKIIPTFPPALVGE